MIARAGADLENLVAGTHVQGLGHQPHHQRLADRLMARNRQGGVFIRAVAEGFRHEQFTGRPLDRVQHSSIGDPAAA